MSEQTIINEGAQMLYDALDSGKVSLVAIRREYKRDQAVLNAREWLGDIDHEQRTITQGIKLRQQVRLKVLAARTQHCIEVGDNERGEKMALVAVSEWKQVECDECARVSSVVKWIPLKLACCGSCGSLKIRLYRTADERRKRNERLAAKRRVTTNQTKDAGVRG